MTKTGYELYSLFEFEEEAVGLLSVDDAGEVRVPIPARPSPRLLPFARGAIRLPRGPERDPRGSLFSKGAIGLQPF